MDLFYSLIFNKVLEIKGVAADKILLHLVELECANCVEVCSLELLFEEGGVWEVVHVEGNASDVVLDEHGVHLIGTQICLAL